jgi:periplasmic protein CpxP/Spy
MSSRIAFVTLMAAALSASGLMAKQDTSLSRRQNARANFVERLSTDLNLTDRQKQQAKAIFTAERDAALSMRQELRQDRKAVETAIQAGKADGEVRQLARNEGPVLANLAAMRAGAFAKFYAVLTPAQQQKLASLHREHRAENR